MRKEYELRDGKANPYAKRIGVSGRAAILEQFLRSEHFVRLDDDVAKAFPDEAVVNETLRLALRMNVVLAKREPSSAKRRRSKKSA